jgi:hypothetical protein
VLGVFRGRSHHHLLHTGPFNHTGARLPFTLSIFQTASWSH